MTLTADSRVESPGPRRVPGTRHVDDALFFSGLVACVALLVVGSLAVMAVLPMIVPGYTTASITSGSMMPTLRVGDVVVAVDHDGSDIEPGTVVIYEDPTKHDLVTHRIVSTNADGSFTTKGDASAVDDPAPIPSANIRGKARWVVPFVGLPRVWAAQRQWALLLLMTAAVATAVWLSRFAFDPRYDPWPNQPRPDVDVAP